MMLLPTFRLPTLIHTRSGNAKYLNEISHRNPLWMSPRDAAPPGPRARATWPGSRTEIGYFVNRVWVTEGIAPGVVACSHHLGRWRLHEGEGSRWSTARVSLTRDAGGPVLLRQLEGVGPFDSPDPDSKRIWWSDGGVHQNLAFPVHPDPVSGMHCWHQKVVVDEGAARGSLRRRLRRHRALDGGLPGVAGQGAARSRSGRAAAAALARPAAAARRGDVPGIAGAHSAMSLTRLRTASKVVFPRRAHAASTSSRASWAPGSAAFTASQSPRRALLHSRPRSPPEASSEAASAAGPRCPSRGPAASFPPGPQAASASQDPRHERSSRTSRRSAALHGHCADLA